MKRTTKAIAAIMLMFATMLATGCTEKENNRGDANDTTDTLCDCVLATGDWVDLGLPSGLLWATRNVGASSPTDYGSYYAWGETSPKSVYRWDNYRYGGYYELTKYCTDSAFGYNGFTDSLTTLQTGDDAATANYGGHTPTYAEWQELINNTTNRWVTINNVNGHCFTGSNGNSIFLPAAGHRYDVTLHDDCNLRDDCTRGCYWSSSLYLANPLGALICQFDSFPLIPGGIVANSRQQGLSVRAVRLP